jgi:chromosome segregation ATPase
MPTDEERIAEALASGLWREKVDAKTGRKYYVNTRTKQSVWSLIAELDKQAAVTSQTAPLTRNLREERQEKLKKKAEQANELKISVATLEQKKVEMEAELARLRAPVEAETKQLEELRAQVNDMKFSLRVVENESSEKRKAREAELRTAQAKVEALKTQVDAEKQHKHSVEMRRMQLNAEALDLKQDLHKEQVNTEALKATLRAAERKQEEAKAELSRLDTEIAAEEELVRLAQDDLEALAKQKNEIIKKIQEATAQKNELSERVALVKNNDKSRSLEQQGNNLLNQLVVKYETKKRQLKLLSQSQDAEGEARRLEQSNGKLRTLLAAANRDKETLMALADCLEKETNRIKDLTAFYQSEMEKARLQNRATQAAAVASGNVTVAGATASRRQSSTALPSVIYADPVPRSSQSPFTGTMVVNVTL